jgi:hypothetical protein
LEQKSVCFIRGFFSSTLVPASINCPVNIYPMQKIEELDLLTQAGLLCSCSWSCLHIASSTYVKLNKIHETHVFSELRKYVLCCDRALALLHFPSILTQLITRQVGYMWVTSCLLTLQILAMYWRIR